MKVSARTLVSVVLGCFLFVASQTASLPALGQNTPDKVVESGASRVSCTDNFFSQQELAPGALCQQELFARRGHPLMFPARDGVAFGVSSSPGNPLLLILWVDNQNDKKERFSFCCVSTLFEHIDIVDSQGHRVLSKADRLELTARSTGQEPVRACSCSGLSDIPAHTIQIFMVAEVHSGYDLPPGQYVVTERYPPSPYNLSPDKQKSGPHVPPGLAISISK